MNGTPSPPQGRRWPKLSWRDWRMKILTVCLALAVLVPNIWFLYERAGRTRTAMLDSFAMGSYVEQTVWGPRAEQAAKDVSAALAELEEDISWRREGEIARLNQSAGKDAVPLSKETGSLLETALELCERSKGGFDITLGPVTRLWDFDGSPRLPGPEELESALALVDYRKVSMDKEEYMYAVPNEDGSHTDSLGVRYHTALAEPGMAIELGAIGKGAACDTAVSMYICQAEVNGAVIAVGGSVGLYGQKPDGQPWKVSVRDPKEAGSLGVLTLPGGFVSTSGSYEKYFEQDGRRYHHLLDPRTGYPAESGLVSVTVWCQDSGALSDGLATACFVLGLEDGLALLESYGAQGLFVDESGTVTLTPGLRERFTLTGEGYTIG